MHNKCFRVVTNIRYNDVDSVTCWNLNVLFYSLYQEKQGHKNKSCSKRSKADFITYTFVTKEFNFKNVLWSNRERERNVSLHSFGSCSYIERSLSNHIPQRNSTTWVTWFKTGHSGTLAGRIAAVRGLRLLLKAVGLWTGLLKHEPSGRSYVSSRKKENTIFKKT